MKLTTLDETTLLNAIQDRFEGWELVEYMNISTEEIIEAFRDRILDNYNDNNNDWDFVTDE